MAVVTMRQLLEAGVHFGHQTRRWNPKMRPFIFGERNGIHILDLRQTLERIEESAALISNAVAGGGTVLFVGTKKQAQASIKEAADEAGMPYVNHRWLGGMLTNFQTIHKRILYMLELEKMETTGEMEALPEKGAASAAARAHEARGRPRRRARPQSATRRGVRHRRQHRAHCRG